MYEPYSKYGAYGRHNREYTRHELASLLKHCGFDVQTSYTANVHDDISPRAEYIGLINAAIDSVVNRKHDLDECVFTSSINASPAQTGPSSWLFRSYPSEEMI